MARKPPEISQHPPNSGVFLNGKFVHVGTRYFQFDWSTEPCLAAMVDAVFRPDLSYLISGVYDERKAILLPGITSAELSRRIKQLLKVMRENAERLFHIEAEATTMIVSYFNSDWFLETEQRILVMILLLKYAAKEPHCCGSDVDRGFNCDRCHGFNAELLPQQEEHIGFMREWMDAMRTSYEASTAFTSLSKGFGMRSRAEAAACLHCHTFMLSWLLFEITGDVGICEVETWIASFAEVDFDCMLNDVLPPTYKANLFLAYIEPSLSRFVGAHLTNRADKVRHHLSIIRQRYHQPMKAEAFLPRHLTVLDKHGWRHRSLEQCCEEVPIEVTLPTDLPFELVERVKRIWHLLDTSHVFAVRIHYGTIFVIEGEIDLYYKQLMRLFYILNRIRELLASKSVSDPIGTRGHNGQLLETFVQLYTEMHDRFSGLCRVLDRYRSIVRLHYDSHTGLIAEVGDAGKDDPEIVAKLRDLCLNMTCPLAIMDTCLQLYMHHDKAPSLFNRTTNQFLLSLFR